MEVGDDFANYHFIKDKAYTEDDVLVYNVFVHNVPKKTSKREFSEYFKKFGDIISVRLLNDRNKNSSRPSQKMGFVNYSDPLSAAKVLQNTHHSIHKRRVWVRACDSWHQPDAQSPAAADGEITTNDALILNLNDDCLDVIFKHLEMEDQINLARCCSRLKDVFVMRAKVEYKILNLDYLEFLTLWEIRQFLQMAGPQIEKLGGRIPCNNFKRVVEFLGIYCTSAKTVSITSGRLSLSNLRKLLKNMHMIEELHLNDVDLKDECIIALKKLKNLKILSLEENFDLTGKNIKDLITVESLSLNGCRRISSASFRMICENLKDLKYLDIQECTHVKLSDIKDIEKYLHKLETVKVSCDNGQVEAIASLPSLKHLHLYNIEPFRLVPSQFFVELAKHRADQLETLAVRAYNSINREKTSSIGELRHLKELICPNNDKFDDNCLDNISKLQELELLNIKNCKSFTDKGLLDLIQKCPKLSTLNVSNCNQLGEEFATKVLELLKSERKQRDQKKPLKIIAHSSGIPLFAVNTPAFESATDLLSISFEYEMDGIYLDNLSGSDNDIDEYFYGSDGDEDDYMYFSDNMDDDDLGLNDDLDFDVLRRFLFRYQPYAGDGHDLMW